VVKVLRQALNEGTLRAFRMLTVSNFQNLRRRALFDDVSLQVNRGDRIGLVGPNGAGKSTLFALLLGNVSPDKGTIAIEKERNDRISSARNCRAGEETVLELALAVSPALVHAQKVIKEHEAAVAGIADPGGRCGLPQCAPMFLTSMAGGSSNQKQNGSSPGSAFRETDFDRPRPPLSGGWIMRASSRAPCS